MLGIDLRNGTNIESKLESFLSKGCVWFALEQVLRYDEFSKPVILS